MFLALALACNRPPPCPENAGWEPALESVALYREGDIAWIATSGTLDVDASTGCQTAPCVQVTGGGAAFSPELNRAETYTIRGRVYSTTAATLTVRELGSGGTTNSLGGQEFPAGVWTDVQAAFTPEQGQTAVTIALTSAGDLWLDDFALDAELWAEATENPSGEPVALAFLIHIEEAGFKQDEAVFRRKARVVEGLTGVFLRHDARLTVQPDETFLTGVSAWSPDWLLQRMAEGTGWSVKLHAGGEEAAATATARQAFEALGFDITDVNGGFGTAPWAEMEKLGARSLTAYKNPETQAALPRAYSHPWRPPEGAVDAEDFVLADSGGPLLYLPGHPKREAVHERVGEAIRRVMSQVLVHADGDGLNTWYFMLHVDDFPSGAEDEATVDAYLDGAGFQEDLLYYEVLFEDVLDPLVEAGLLHYSVPMDMAVAAEEQCR